jgi:hypothetical protein
MAKKIASGKSVAYFTPPLVDEPGFYIVEEAEENVSTSAGEFAVSVHSAGDRVYADPSGEKDGFFDAPLDDGGEA